MLLPALFISGLVVFFALRVAVGYSRIVTAIKRLDEEAVAQLPAQIRAAIDSRWVGSRQSPVLYEIAIRVVSGEFSKKADHGKWFGAKAKNHQQKEYHDPPEAER